jgi:hypothetical protein
MAAGCYGVRWETHYHANYYQGADGYLAVFSVRIPVGDDRGDWMHWHTNQCITIFLKNLNERGLIPKKCTELAPPDYTQGNLLTVFLVAGSNEFVASAIDRGPVFYHSLVRHMPTFKGDGIISEQQPR